MCLYNDNSSAAILRRRTSALNAPLLFFGVLYRFLCFFPSALSYAFLYMILRGVFLVSVATCTTSLLLAYWSPACRGVKLGCIIWQRVTSDEFKTIQAIPIGSCWCHNSIQSHSTSPVLTIAHTGTLEIFVWWPQKWKILNLHFYHLAPSTMACWLPTSSFLLPPTCHLLLPIFHLPPTTSYLLPPAYRQRAKATWGWSWLHKQGS